MMNDPKTNVLLSANALDVAACYNFVTSPQSGGIDIFVGTVRNHTKERPVLRLEFEAYEKMALSELNKIADHLIAHHPVHKVAIHHRTGTLFPGEIAVIIAVAAAHRDAAFTACRHAIDTLKETVPIWKKEIFTDGEQWVSAHP